MYTSLCFYVGYFVVAVAGIFHVLLELGQYREHPVAVPAAVS